MISFVYIGRTLFTKFFEIPLPYITHVNYFVYSNIPKMDGAFTVRR